MPRVHSLGAVFTAGHSEKEDPRVTERKENVHDQVSNLDLEEKAMHHREMTRTRLSGEKEKEKARRARKESKERLLSKECLHGRAKAKVMANSREESKTFNNNLHKQMLHSSHHRAQCLPQTNKKLPMPKRAGVGVKHIGQTTGHGIHTPTTVDMKEITPKVIGTIGRTLLPVRN